MWVVFQMGAGAPAVYDFSVGTSASWDQIRGGRSWSSAVSQISVWASQPPGELAAVSASAGSRRSPLPSQHLEAPGFLDSPMQP